MKDPIDIETYWFNFGQYKNRPYKYVLLRDPFYIKWLIDEGDFYLKGEDMLDLINRIDKITSERGY